MFPSLQSLPFSKTGRFQVTSQAHPLIPSNPSINLDPINFQKWEIVLAHLVDYIKNSLSGLIVNFIQFPIIDPVVRADNNILHE